MPTDLPNFMAIISVYSQNVSGDRHSEELTTLKEMERWTFYNRIRTIISALPENVDVICLNEVSWFLYIQYLVCCKHDKP